MFRMANIEFAQQTKATTSEQTINLQYNNEKKKTCVYIASMCNNLVIEYKKTNVCAPSITILF